MKYTKSFIAGITVIVAIAVTAVPAEARRGVPSPRTTIAPTTTVAPTTTTVLSTTTVAPTTTVVIAPTTTVTPLCYDHLIPVYDPDVCLYLSWGGIIWSE